jgi:hypothetical protein
VPEFGDVMRLKCFFKRDAVCRPDIEGMARGVSTRREREAVAAISDDAEGADESDGSCRVHASNSCWANHAAKSVVMWREG